MNFIKKHGKVFLCKMLESQVRSLRAKQKFIIVAVAGSVGKTSTKLAIATLLGSELRVRHQEGNYNDRLTVPLVIFGHKNPGLFNLFSWGRIILSNYLQIMKPFPFDVVVLELGTDAPGQIAEFSYLRPDISVVTAATPEHMEFFGNVETVAKEELSVLDFSGKALVNIDDIPSSSVPDQKNVVFYGSRKQSFYRFEQINSDQPLPQKIRLYYGKDQYSSQIKLMGSQGAKVALAAFAVACELGFDPKHSADFLANLQAFSGRMRLLNGIRGSTLIDDTYNASPAAVSAALDVLYSFSGSQKIAILGMMNELGDTSKAAHIEMGNYCDPDKLDLVVTIGADSREFTAPAARERGCTVESFDSPYEAGEYVKKHLKQEAVVLAKGSQNRVFAEEALKSLLSEASDINKLVRQSPYWLKIKAQQFPGGDKAA